MFEACHEFGAELTPMTSCIDATDLADMPDTPESAKTRQSHDCIGCICAGLMAGYCHVCTHGYINVLCAEGRHSSANGASQGSLEQESGQVRFEAVLEAVCAGAGLGLSEFKENFRSGTGLMRMKLN